MKNMYEVFDEFENARSKKDKMDVIGRNLSPTLIEVLRLTFHPNFQWYVEDMPENYIVPMDTKLPGLGRTQLSTDLRKLYLFQKGHPTADKLSSRKRNELLIQMLETLEPREAEVVAGIFRKDQCVNGLDYQFVKEAFPHLLP
jgi:hypothetical protein